MVIGVTSDDKVIKLRLLAQQQNVQLEVLGAAPIGTWDGG